VPISAPAVLIPWCRQALARSPDCPELVTPRCAAGCAETLATELGLEALDLRVQRRLRDEALLRRLRHIASFGHREEVP
jgi:hypothetical protein